MKAITKSYMGHEDAADYFAQNVDRAELVHAWLLAEGREFTAYRVADTTVFRVDGWMRITAMADSYLCGWPDHYVFLTRDPQYLAIRGSVAVKLLNSAQWELLEAKFSGLALVDGPCPIGGAPPISERKQAVLAHADNAVQVLSFEPMTTRQARQWLQGWDNGIHRGNEASWRGDRITVYAGGKYYPAMCYEY